jgi:hypothetical protein
MIPRQRVFDDIESGLDAGSSVDPTPNVARRPSIGSLLTIVQTERSKSRGP